MSARRPRHQRRLPRYSLGWTVPAPRGPGPPPVPRAVPAQAERAKTATALLVALFDGATRAAVAALGTPGCRCLRSCSCHGRWYAASHAAPHPKSCPHTRKPPRRRYAAAAIGTSVSADSVASVACMVVHPVIGHLDHPTRSAAAAPPAPRHLSNT